MTTIRSIRVLSAAKVMALFHGVLGLLFAPFFLLGPGLAMMGGGVRPAGFGAVILFAVFLPFCYAVLGFIGGALMAFLYNAIASGIGGIEIDLQLPPPVIYNTPPVIPPIATAPVEPPPFPPQVG